MPAQAQLTVTPQDRRGLIALAIEGGLTVGKEHDGTLYDLLFSETAKSSLHELTVSEFRAFRTTLINRLRGNFKYTPRERSVSGMMTGKQIKKAWALMYRIKELDPSPAAVGDRMRGAIKSALGLDCSAKEPFRWISFDQGEKLIETLKGYARSAERKKKKQG